jgi:hypothetical protein
MIHRYTMIYDMIVPGVPEFGPKIEDISQCHSEGVNYIKLQSLSIADNAADHVHHNTMPVTRDQSTQIQYR